MSEVGSHMTTNMPKGKAKKQPFPDATSMAEIAALHEQLKCAIAEKEKAVADLDQANAEREKAVSDLHQANAEEEQANEEKDKTVSDLDQASEQLDQVMEEKVELNRTLSDLNARVDEEINSLRQMMERERKATMAELQQKDKLINELQSSFHHVPIVTSTPAPKSVPSFQRSRDVPLPRRSEYDGNISWQGFIA